MIDHNSPPPRGEQMQTILAGARVRVLREVRASRSSRRRRRGRVGGAILVGAIAMGGVTTAAATGILGGVEETHTKTATLDLGPAPAGSTYVFVTVDVVCQPSARYEIDLDHAKNPASLLCGKTENGKAAQLGSEMELIDKGPNHSLTVTTSVERKYTVRAHYRTGRTQNQQLNAKVKDLEQQRDQNGRTVHRTNKTPSGDPYNHPAEWPDPYYVAKNGMTIGTFDAGTTPYDQWPDLMPAEGPHGEQAFTYSGKRGQLLLVGKEDPTAYKRWLVETGQSSPARSGSSTKRFAIYLKQDGETVVAKTYAGSSE